MRATREMMAVLAGCAVLAGGCEQWAEIADYAETPPQPFAPCSPSSADICNGRDDDCDGTVDEDGACADACGAAQVSASCALRNDGTIWCWTIDAQGAVTLARWDDGHGPFVELAAEDDRPACARRIDGGLWCRRSALADVGYREDPLRQLERTRPVRVKSLGFDVVEVGPRCVRKADGSVWCGGGVSAPERLPLPARAVRLGSGDSTNCTLLETGAVECLISPRLSGFAGATAIEVGLAHVCTLGVGGAVRCAGANFVGQLCRDSLTESREAGPALPFESGVEQLAVSGSETCALRSDGHWWCCGVADGRRALTDGRGFDGRLPRRQDGLGPGVRTLDLPCGITTAGKVICRRQLRGAPGEPPTDLQPAVFDLCPPGGSR